MTHQYGSYFPFSQSTASVRCLATAIRQWLLGNDRVNWETACLYVSEDLRFHVLLTVAQFATLLVRLLAVLVYVPVRISVSHFTLSCGQLAPITAYALIVK